jgi:hypothetical protein
MTCLTVAGAYFKSSIKESSWAKFHDAVADQNNMRRLDEIFTPKVSTWLCFTTFEIMLKNVCNNDTTTETFDNNSESDIYFTGRDRYIIIYIGGAVVRKVTQKHYILKNIELKHEILGFCIGLTRVLITLLYWDEMRVKVCVCPCISMDIFVVFFQVKFLIMFCM